MKKPLVSVCVITYNQVKYVRQTLESIVKQKTEFPFEILIHDDASTDGTEEIIREYERKYPELITGVYETENQYSKDPKISLRFLYPIAQGKYFAYCEGDDYWVDNYKLQKQFETLEKHPECSLCTHKVRTITDRDTDLFKFPPINLKEGIISPEQYIHEELGNSKWMFQTSCYFASAKYMKEWLTDLPEFVCLTKAGDIAMVLYLLTRGSVYYIDEEMSHYRLASLGSVSSTLFASRDYRIQQMRDSISMIKSYDYYTRGIYHLDITSYIERNEYHILLNTAQFKKIRDSKYKQYFNELKGIKKIYTAICTVCPTVDRIVRFLIKR